MFSSDLPGPRAPLPGTSTPKRALFIDRWGTLFEQPQKGWCARFSDVQFYPGVLDALFRAQQSGWMLYLIGNEPQVAQGKQSESSWASFESELMEHMQSFGITITRNYACLDHPSEAKGKHLKDSVFLLPNTGVMYHAMQHDGVQLEHSWVIGDGRTELAAGWRSGCRLMSVQTGAALGDQGPEVDVSLAAEDLTSALREILQAEVQNSH